MNKKLDTEFLGLNTFVNQITSSLPLSQFVLYMLETCFPGVRFLFAKLTIDILG